MNVQHQKSKCVTGHAVRIQSSVFLDSMHVFPLEKRKLPIMLVEKYITLDIHSVICPDLSHFEDNEDVLLKQD